MFAWQILPTGKIGQKFVPGDENTLKFIPIEFSSMYALQVDNKQNEKWNENNIKGLKKSKNKKLIPCVKNKEKN